MCGKFLKSHSTTILWNHLQKTYPKIYGKLKNVEHSVITDIDDSYKAFQKIPQSSVNSELLFSAAKRIYTDNRNCLASNNTEKLFMM